MEPKRGLTGLCRVLTCTVGPLVGPFGLEAFVLALGQRRKLGGDLLLHDGRLVHLVGGADQVHGQLRFDWLGADALFTQRNLGWNLHGIGGGGQDVGPWSRGQSPASVHDAPPERRGTEKILALGRKRKMQKSHLLF